MTLPDFITRSRILTDMALEDEREAIPLLAQCIAGDLGIDPEPVEEALSGREKLGSTAIGKGVALPHAKCAAVMKPAGAMLLLKEPLSSTTPDGIPLDIFIGFVIPADANDLAILGQLAKLLREDDFLRELRAAKSPTQAHASLKSHVMRESEE